MIDAVDVHAHIYPRAYMDRALELANSDDSDAAVARFTVNHPVIRDDDMFFDAHRRIAGMDAAGIRTQILSFAAPNILSMNTESRTATVRVFNDSVAQIAAEHPGRFGLFANLPLPFVAESIREIDRMAEVPGVAGWSVSAHYRDKRIDDPDFAAVWERLDRDGALIYVHPDAFSAPGVLKDYGMEWTLGAAFDDTIVAFRLILSGILDRYEGLTWIIPHLGGALVALRGRLDIGWMLIDDVRKRLERAPSEYVPRLVFDCATLQPSAIRFATEILGDGNVVYGSDFPYVHRANLAGATDVLEGAGLSAADQKAVRVDNFLARCSPRLAPGYSSLLPHLAPVAGSGPGNDPTLVEQ